MGVRAIRTNGEDQVRLSGVLASGALASPQVAEHWKPELVPFIQRELARVAVPGGLWFCALETEELFAR